MRILPLLPLLLLPATRPASAEDVPLRLRAEAAAPVVTRIAPDHPAITGSAPVPDRQKAEAGWRRTEARAGIEGHLRTGNLSKDFEAEAGTPVHSRPRPGAEVVTRIEKGDAVRTLGENEDWTKVLVRKPMVFYFQRQPETDGSSGVLGADIRSNGENRENDTPQRRSRSASRGGEVGALDPGELPPENVEWRSSGGGRAPSVSSRSTARPDPPEPRTPGGRPQNRSRPSTPADEDGLIPAEDLRDTSGKDTPARSRVAAESNSRTLVGTLIRKIRRTGPRYPIRLRNDSDRRIAYVDLSQIFLPDIRPYLGEEVRITGEVHPIVPGSDELVIVARTLRTNN